MNDDLLSNENEEGENSSAPAKAKASSRAPGTALTLSSEDSFDISGAVHHTIKPGELLNTVNQRVRLVMMILGWFYSGLVFITVVLAVCLLAPGAIYALDHSTPWLLHFARIVIALVTWVFILGCAAIGLLHNHLKESLEDAEYELDALRDMTLIQMQATRYNLEELTEKLKFPVHKEEPSALDYINVARKIGPFLSILTSPERNLVTIGVEGLKFFQAVKKILNR